MVIILMWFVGAFLTIWLIDTDFGLKNVETMRGGTMWFLVESKSFEILVEVVRDRLKGVIVERSKRFSSWIRFGEPSPPIGRSRREL